MYDFDFDSNNNHLSIKKIKKNLEQLLKLWYHESCRVFQDRLVNNQDREWFEALLKEKIKSDFAKEFTDVINRDTVIYGDFMSTNTDNRVYAEIDDLAQVSRKIHLKIKTHSIGRLNYS